MGATLPSELDRGLSTPTAPPTDLQRRLSEAMDEQSEHRATVRGGGPEGMTEVDRELTMVEGAIQGVQQRLASLASILTPVLHPAALEAIRAPEPLRTADSFEIVTGYGTRLRHLQDSLHEIESVLGVLSNSVRA